MASGLGPLHPMSLFGAGANRPDHPAGASPSQRPDPGRAGGAAGLLLNLAADTRRESRHVAIGMGLLILVSAVLLNFGVYQSNQTRLVQQRWERLSHRVDLTRDQVRQIFATFERQVHYLADDPRFTSWVRSAMEGSLDDGGRR